MANLKKNDKVTFSGKKDSAGNLLDSWAHGYDGFYIMEPPVLDPGSPLYGTVAITNQPDNPVATARINLSDIPGFENWEQDLTGASGWNGITASMDPTSAGEPAVATGIVTNSPPPPADPWAGVGASPVKAPVEIDPIGRHNSDWNVAPLMYFDPQTRRAILALDQAGITPGIGGGGWMKGPGVLRDAGIDPGAFRGKGGELLNRLGDYQDWGNMPITPTASALGITPGGINYSPDATPEETGDTVRRVQGERDAALNARVHGFSGRPGKY